MEEFLKSLIKNLFFIIIAIFFLLPVFWVSPILGNVRFTRGGYGHMFSRLNEIENTTEKTLLFLGSSHTYRNFDTFLFALIIYVQ